MNRMYHIVHEGTIGETLLLSDKLNTDMGIALQGSSCISQCVTFTAGSQHAAWTVADMYRHMHTHTAALTTAPEWLLTVIM